MGRPLPPGIRPPPARGRRWQWWLLLALTLVGWTPVVLWAAGLLLADGLGCRVDASPVPCPSALGEVGDTLHAMVFLGGWLMIPAAPLAVLTGIAWILVALALVVRRARGGA